MKKPLTIIILAAIMIGLGAGGYFAYTNYVEPMMNPYSKLIPDGLKEYAKGADADGFVIIKNDADTQKIIKSFPILPAVVSDFQSGLILIKASSQTIVAVIQFSGADSAKAVADLVKSQLSSLKINLEQKDRYLIASNGGGITSFTGSLLDNPNIKTLDPKLLDSQIIIGLDTLKMQEALTIPSTILNGIGGNIPGGTGNIDFSSSAFLSAHAQGLISNEQVAPAQTPALSSMNTLMSMAKSCSIYLRLKGDNLTGKLVLNIMAKSELAGSPIAAMMKKQGASDAAANLETTYDAAVKSLNDNLPELQKQADQVQKQLPGSSVKVSFAGTVLQMSYDVPFSELQKMGMAASDAAPKKARDAERKVHVNDIVMTLEQYNAVNNKYPQKSACVDEISEIQSLFMGGKPPVDSNSPIDFKAATCKGGFYYQYAPKGEQQGYVVWAKMEGENGNTNGTPDEYAASQLATGFNPPEIQNGTYYVVNTSAFSTAPAEISSPVKRIKRNGATDTTSPAVITGTSSTSGASAAFSELAKTNNAQRSVDVKIYLDSIHQYGIDNRGKLPTSITLQEMIIGNGPGQVDICSELVPTYIASMPFDPTASGAHFTDCTDYNTGYTVSGSSGKVTVRAPNAELGIIIGITR